MIRRPPNSTLFPYPPLFRSFPLLPPTRLALVCSAAPAISPRTSLSILPPVFSLAIHSGWAMRSEEHTSELQSQSNLVCRLLLEKKNTSIIHRHHLILMVR